MLMKLTPSCREEKVHIKCAKDCGPHQHTPNCSRMLVFLPAHKDHAYFFLISTSEELSQPTKLANKIIISIILIFDTHDSRNIRGQCEQKC